MESMKRKDLERIEDDLKFPKRFKNQDLEIVEKFTVKKITEVDDDLIEIKKSYVIPAPFNLHLQILAAEFAAFRGGDEAGLPVSLARMNAVLDGPVLVGESPEIARAAVRRWLGKLAAHADAIGNLNSTPSRKMVFSCARLIIRKLTDFAEKGVVSEPRVYVEPEPGNFNEKIRQTAEALGTEIQDLAIFFVKLFGAESSVNAAKKFREKFQSLPRAKENLEICRQKPWLLGILISSPPSVISKVLV